MITKKKAKTMRLKIAPHDIEKACKNYAQLERRTGIKLDNQFYIGQKGGIDHVRKCLKSYIKFAWPWPMANYKDSTIHSRINNKSYVIDALRYQKERIKLKREYFSFCSAHDNLAVFDKEGLYIPIDDHKYI